MDKTFEELLSHLPPSTIDQMIKYVKIAEEMNWTIPDGPVSPELSQLKLEMVKYMVREHWLYLKRVAPDSIVNVIVGERGGREAFCEKD